MNRVFAMHEKFGSFLADGNLANEFRFTEVEPALSVDDEVVFDFRGVRNMTTSFSNGLVATLVAHFPGKFSDHVRFRGCDPLIKEILQASIAIGRREALTAAS
jgi:hypothetical protein